MELWEMEARLEIQDLLAKYVQYADTGKGDAQADLFSEDAVLDITAGRAEGRDAIRLQFRGLRERVATTGSGSSVIRHFLSSINIDIDSQTAARATSYVMTVREAGAESWGLYRDQFVKADGRWLFAQRTSKRIGPPAP